MNEPIRILHVFSIMNRGGAESMIMNLYRHIDKSVIQFDFVVHTNDEGAFDSEILSLGGKIYRVPRYKGTNHIEYIKSWNSLLSETSKTHTILHSHIRSTAIFYLNRAKKYGFKTIIHSHSSSNGKGYESIVKKLFQFRLRNIADYFFAASDTAAQWLFGNDIITNPNYYLINNSIDAKSFIYNPDIRSEYRKVLDIEQNFVIGNVGNFKDVKNQLFLIDIFAEVLRRNQSSKLILVGDGEDRTKIEEKIKKLGIEASVLILGVRSDIPNILQSIDLFCFPSKFEGLGLAAIEAQAAGLHTIVSNGIPKEAFVTDLIESVNLTDSIDVWCKKNSKIFKRIY